MPHTFTFTAPLDDTDRSVMRLLLGTADPVIIEPKPVTIEPVPAPIEPEPVTIEPDTVEAAPKRKRRTKAEMEADAAATVETEAEPVEFETETPDGPSVADAIARAQELMKEGKTATVKEALSSFGVAKVSHLSPADIKGFMDTLADA